MYNDKYRWGVYTISSSTGNWILKQGYVYSSEAQSKIMAVRMSDLWPESKFQSMLYTDGDLKWNSHLPGTPVEKVLTLEERVKVLEKEKADREAAEKDKAESSRIKHEIAMNGMIADANSYRNMIERRKLNAQAAWDHRAAYAFNRNVEKRNADKAALAAWATDLRGSFTPPWVTTEQFKAETDEMVLKKIRNSVAGLHFSPELSKRLKAVIDTQTEVPVPVPVPTPITCEHPIIFELTKPRFFGYSHRNKYTCTTCHINFGEFAKGSFVRWGSKLVEN